MPTLIIDFEINSDTVDVNLGRIVVNTIVKGI